MLRHDGVSCLWDNHCQSPVGLRWQGEGYSAATVTVQSTTTCTTHSLALSLRYCRCCYQISNGMPIITTVCLAALIQQRGALEFIVVRRLHRHLRWLRLVAITTAATMVKRYFDSIECGWKQKFLENLLYLCFQLEMWGIRSKEIEAVTEELRANGGDNMTKTKRSLTYSTWYVWISIIWQALTTGSDCSQSWVELVVSFNHDADDDDVQISFWLHNLLLLGNEPFYHLFIRGNSGLQIERPPTCFY